MTIKEEVVKEKGLIWEHNITSKAKAIAGTYARYGYEKLIDEHNENIKRAISLTLQEVSEIIRTFKGISSQSRIRLLKRLGDGK